LSPPAPLPPPPVDGGVHERFRLRRADALRRTDLADELRPAALHQLGGTVEDLAPVVRGGGGPSSERLARGGAPGGRVLARGEGSVGEEAAARVAHHVG